MITFLMPNYLEDCSSAHVALPILKCPPLRDSSRQNLPQQDLPLNSKLPTRLRSPKSRSSNSTRLEAFQFIQTNSLHFQPHAVLPVLLLATSKKTLLPALPIKAS